MADANGDWIYANKAHPKSDKEQEYWDEMTGRGDGDPDIYGYPGENDEPQTD